MCSSFRNKQTFEYAEHVQTLVEHDFRLPEHKALPLCKIDSFSEFQPVIEAAITLQEKEDVLHFESDCLANEHPKISEFPQNLFFTCRIFILFVL